MTKLLYRDRYRIPSTRLSSHDYATPGWYFITICTNSRYPWFGYIKNGIMCVNDIGSIVVQELYRTELLRNNVVLDTWIIMPDHVHAIIQIVNNTNVAHENHDNDVLTHRRDVARNVSTSCGQTFSKISPFPHSISTIVRAFKSAVTRHMHIIGHSQFQWQPRYHDRIIRSQRELQNVRKYILNNPKNYKKII